MKAFSTLVLLSSVALLCSSAPALEPVTCKPENANEAARMGTRKINMHHKHGYKFRLTDLDFYQMEKTDTGCNIELKLNLTETACHVVNPKHFEDCELSGMTDGSVKSHCTVKMTVKGSDAEVLNFACQTEQGMSNAELTRNCPDCPILLSLDDIEGSKAVQEAVKEFNKNTTNQNYYVLQDVGRIKLGFIMGSNMFHASEIALVESNCPMNSRIAPLACKPLCSHRAKHAVCESSYSKTNGVRGLRCEFFPALDTTPLSPGELEPVCEKPLPVLPDAPTDGAAGSPFRHFLQCHAHQQKFHPICNWP